MKKLLIIGLLSLSASQSYGASCYIMGDSIAQGVAQYIKGCSSATKVGLNTDKAAQYWGNKQDIKSDLSKEIVVVSLGVNDGNNSTLENLIKIRSNISADKIIWILPSKKDKSVIVKKIATHYEDYVLDIRSVIGKDGVHPTGKGYQQIAEKIKYFNFN